KTERYADQTRSHAQSSIKGREALVRVGKRENHRSRDEHHSGDRANPENQQIDNRPFRATNRCEYQQGHRSGAGEAVDKPHHKRPHNLIETELAELAVEPVQRVLRWQMRMSFGFVPVGMRVNVISVAVRMRMARSRSSARRSDGIRDPLKHAGKVQNAQENEHQAHGKLHRQAHPRGNYPAEKNDSASHDEDRERVADSPKRANQRSVADPFVSRDDGRDGDDVVGVCGMAHPEKESKSDYGK